MRGPATAKMDGDAEDKADPADPVVRGGFAPLTVAERVTRCLSIAARNSFVFSRKISLQNKII